MSIRHSLLSLPFAAFAVCATAAPSDVAFGDAKPVKLPFKCGFSEKEGFKPNASHDALATQGWRLNDQAKVAGAFDVKPMNKWTDGALYLTDMGDESPSVGLVLPKVPAGHVAVEVTLAGKQSQYGRIQLATGKKGVLAELLLKDNLHGEISVGEAKRELQAAYDKPWFHKLAKANLAWRTVKPGEVAYTLTFTPPESKDPVVFEGTAKEVPDRLVLASGFHTAKEGSLVVESLEVAEDKAGAKK